MRTGCGAGGRPRIGTTTGVDLMKRRNVLTLVGGAALAAPLLLRGPRDACAQPRDRIRRVGVLMGLAPEDPESQARLAAFAQGLQQAGWNVGQNLRLGHRESAENIERMRKYAAELVALNPDAILAHSSAAVAPLLQLTRSIPIVFTL